MVEVIDTARLTGGEPPDAECHPPRLRMRGIRKRFGATVALDDVDLAVHDGEVHALVGENGAGKSTLMKILSGAERPDAGRLELAGTPFRPAGPRDARRAGIAMIYQELSLAEHLTVEENVVLGMEPTTLGFVRHAAARRTTREALDLLGHADIPPHARVRRLSVAERQLVEVARAVAVGCRVLVLDEPTSSLGREDTRRLFVLIQNLKRQGHAIVYISHFIEEVKEIADRITVLRDGKTAGSVPAASVTIPEIVNMMIGRRLAQLYPRSAHQPGEEALVVTDLAGMQKPTAAGFTLRRGEVLGVAGLVGAGRTELLRAIFSLDRVRRGEVRVGALAGPSSPWSRLTQGVGLLSENREGEGLALSLSLLDNLTLSNMTHMGPLGLVLPSQQRTATNRWIQRLGIRCRGADQRAGALSGGNQQKVALARLLHHNVDVLLLDEPTRGVDVASKAQIYQLIDELAVGAADRSRPPRAVLVVSSYLPELLGTCDRIAVMCRGVLGPARPVAEWDEHSLLLAATGQGAP